MGEIVSLNRSMEEEGGREVLYTQPGLVAAHKPDVTEVLEKNQIENNEKITEEISEHRAIQDEVREDLIQTTKASVNEKTEIDEEEVRGLLKVEEMLRAPREQDTKEHSEIIEKNASEVTEIEGEVKGVFKVIELLEQPCEQNAANPSAENSFKITEPPVILDEAKENLIETTKEKSIEETVRSEVSFDQDETLPSTARLLDPSVSAILTDGEDCMCDTLLGGLGGHGEKSEDAKEQVEMIGGFEEVNENMTVTKENTFEKLETFEASFDQEEIQPNTASALETAASGILEDGENCMCDTILGGLGGHGEEREDAKEQVEVIGGFEEVNENMTAAVEPSSLESVGTDDDTKVVENGEVKGDFTMKNVIDTGGDSSEEGDASTDEGYDEEKKGGGAKGLRKALKKPDGTEEVKEAAGSVEDD